MNKVFLIGRLAADPELRTTQSGTPVANYRLAVNRYNSTTGQQEADFFQCIAWNKAAEFAARHLNKGTKIAIVGYLQTRSYDAQDGSKRYVTEIVVNEHEFCESKGAGYQEHAQTAPAANSTISQAQAAFGAGFVEVTDDELPF